MAEDEVKQKTNNRGGVPFSPNTITPTQDINDQTTQNPSSGYPYGYGYGGGYGSGSAAPTAQQKKAQKNQGAVTGFNFKTPGLMFDYGTQSLDENDKFLERQRDEIFKRAGQAATNDWYKQQQDLQSVTSQIADASGNAMNGSFMNDFWDLVARRDDQDDVEILNTLRENMNNAWSDYDEAYQQNINARNELAMDAEEARRDIMADYVALSNNMHPDLADEYLDTENHTINAPEWLKPDFFKDNFREAHTPTSQGLFRPANTADIANRDNQINKNEQNVSSSSTNQDYWTRMRNGYGRRGQ